MERTIADHKPDVPTPNVASLQKGKAKSFRGLQIFCVVMVAFLAIDLIAGLLCRDQWAFDAAAAVCRQNGWQPSDYSAGESNITPGLIGKFATLEFTPRDQTRCKSIRIILHKPINLIPWKVMEYTENSGQP